MAKFVELACDANGLCLIKKLIPQCAKSTELAKSLILIMSTNSMELVQSPYGNYAIQIAFDTFPIEECVVIIDSLRGKLTQLSMLKFSSNVIEKCLEKADLKRRSEMIREMSVSDKLLGNAFS